MEPWYKVVTPRKEVREGRSFNPDEFAIALEQVVSGSAPDDYCKPEQFFARTCFTRALSDHAGMVLRRLAGKTEGTAPVLTLVTQFGGGKTHTLTALYHLAKEGKAASRFDGIPKLLEAAALPGVPEAAIAVFVGNAWDPRPGRETPWIDLARQLAGDAGVAALGTAARTAPPGTEALADVFRAAGRPVLILCDEVLNFVNRHRPFAEPFHAFLQNLTVAMTGTERGAAVISLPRSQVEMTPHDQEWQDRITKVVRRVAKDLIANDESEIAEVVRRRLFDDLGPDRTRKAVARTYADWCYERRERLPPEWTAVDSASTEKKAREYLQGRFEACYPFHPATLSVFQRKWQALHQYQQTRGTLAMLAQWVSCASVEQFKNARTEPLITLGSAPLEVPGFRAAVLGQLGESRLLAAITSDISGDTAHAKALDADTRGALRGIHRRVGTTILFESSGGQVDRVAHLPELRFALGEPEVDTTSIDTAAATLEAKSFFVRRVGDDGFLVSHRATLKKVVNDRRASLDPQTEVKPAIRALVQDEFMRGASPPPRCFPPDGADVPDSPRLSLVVIDPEDEWSPSRRERLAAWTRVRGESPRLYPGAIVWCCRKAGLDLRDKVEAWLAWKRVQREEREGLLGTDFDRADRAELQGHVQEAEQAAREQVWADYRYVALSDGSGKDGIREIDLGAGYSHGTETLAARVLKALQAEALLNESVGAGYLDRNWPAALREQGAWPLASLRQAFLNGSLTRLVDPDRTLRTQIATFVAKGDFGLASGSNPDGTFQRLWFHEPVPPEEVAFDKDVYLLKRDKAAALKAGVVPKSVTPRDENDGVRPPPPPQAPGPGPLPPPLPSTTTLRLVGTVPPQVWNRIGTQLLPKLRDGAETVVFGLELSVTLPSALAASRRAEIQQILADLGLSTSVHVT